MKKFFISIMLVASSSTILAQSITDSLEKKLALSSRDTNRVLILSALCIQYLRSNPTKAMTLAQQGIVLARSLNFRRGEADCLRRSGIIFFNLGRYPEALDIYQKAQVISEGINYSFGIAAGSGHIGNIYAEQGDYSTARFYYYRQLKISEDLHNNSEKAHALGAIGKSYFRQNNLDSALFFYDLTYKSINSKGGILIDDLFKDLGRLYAKRGDNAKAMNFFRQSIPGAIERNDFNTLNESYLGIADLYKKKNQSDSCIFYGKSALGAAQKNNYAKGILEASEFLSKIYERVDEHEEFKYYKTAAAVKDSLFNAEKANQVQNLLFLEQQRKQSIEALRIKNRNNVRLYVVLGALAFSLIVAIIFYRNNQHKKKANVLLHQQKEEVQKTLSELKSTQAQLIQSEKMASLGELTAGIAHEIQNPLNFVNNFSEVNNELINELEEEADKGNINEIKAIAKNIKENEQKINHHGKRADAIVKGMMQHSQLSTGQKETTDINALVDEYLRLSYHGLRAKDKSFNSGIKADFDKTIGKINIVPQDIGRVLLNLFNNAFYSVNDASASSAPDYQPTVSVSTKKLKDKVEIRVKDNGNGIPQNIVDKVFQPFFTTKPTGQGTGLGLSLSYDIIKAHGGEINVESKEGEGTEFTITLNS
ncbi:MAG: ATP-binding protein [Ferruginibacter sp.]